MLVKPVLLAVRCPVAQPGNREAVAVVATLIVWAPASAQKLSSVQVNHGLPGAVNPAFICQGRMEG